MDSLQTAFFCKSFLDKLFSIFFTLFVKTLIISIDTYYLNHNSKHLNTISQHTINHIKVFYQESLCFAKAISRCGLIAIMVQ